MADKPLIYAAKVEIKVSGAEQKVGDDLIDVIVDTNLYLPSMCVINLYDLDFAHTDGTVFDVGKPLEVAFFDARDAKKTIFNGEIVTLEPDFGEDGRHILTIRGYDKSYRLGQGKQTRTYLEMSLADIIKGIVSKYGLSAQTVELSNIKPPYVLQYNQTDLEFLWDKAKSYGCQVFVFGKDFYFIKVDDDRGAKVQLNSAVTLKWNETLRSFRPRVTLVDQVNEVIVNGWDVTKKEAIASTKPIKADTKTKLSKISKTGSSLGSFSGTNVAIINRSVSSISEANAIAEANAANIGSELIQAEGVCEDGDPNLIAGRVVKVEGVGAKFSGDYFVTEARHNYGVKGGYSITFSATGRGPNTTLSHLLTPQSAEDTGRIDGLVVGLVTNIDDPDKLGRVKVKFPWLPKDSGAELESNWVRIASPMSGAERGFFYVPEIDDEVLIAFDHGDVNTPYLVGGLWNGKDKPPEGTGPAVESGASNRRIIRSRSGHLIELDDTDGAEKITIEDMTGANSIVIDSAENSITIKADGDLTIDVKGKFTVNSTKDMTMESKAKSSIKATQDFEIKGLNTKIEAQAQLGVKGTAGVKVESPAIVEVKGSLVKLN